MLERGKMERGVYEIVDTESLVPKDHLLRKIDAAVDFTKIYDMVGCTVRTTADPAWIQWFCLRWY